MQVSSHEYVRSKQPNQLKMEERLNMDSTLQKIIVNPKIMCFNKKNLLSLTNILEVKSFCLEMDSNH